MMSVLWVKDFIHIAIATALARLLATIKTSFRKIATKIIL